MKYAVLAIVAITLIGAVYFVLKKDESETSQPPDSNTQVQQTETTEPATNNETAVPFSPGGKKIVGNYYEYSKADYDSARAAGRPVFLFFYANWCPTCAKQEPIVQGLMGEIEDESQLDDLVAFRVNFNDSDTDGDEEALAKEFGVTYQHTMFTLDEDGNQVQRLLGQTTKDTLKAAFQKAVEA